MSGSYTPEQTGDEVMDLRAEGAKSHRSFVVTIKTPAGHEHRFRVNGEQQVVTVTTLAVEYFVKHGELAEGKYVLAVMRDGTPVDMTASARLEDYEVHERDVLVLIVGEPQVDG